MRVTTRSGDLDDSRDLLRAALEAAKYPVRGVDVIDRDGGDSEIVATLLGTSADPDELDAIVASLDRNPMVESASWTIRTTE
jgi:putative Mg2+ transporter-C (MgtC) family protein